MSIDFENPAELGFRMPAEWEPQEAVWLSWPLNPGTWPDRISAVEREYAFFAAQISRFEKVRLNCVAAEQERVRAILSEAGIVEGNLEIFDLPTNDAWCRDHGPVFVKNDQTGEVAITDWKYNAWGGKFPPWDLDDAVPAKIADALNMRRFAIPIFGEGGGLEVNGEGLLLTTESVFLNPNRNPGYSKPEIESVLRAALGVSEICWLKSGMEGDDTDGHIDTLTRFFKPDAVLTMMEPDVNNPNHAPLQRNYDDLKAYGLEVVPLPSPKPIRPEGWREEVLPASYANYLIINGAVLVPTYRQPQTDDEALKIIADCHPDREIIPVDCYDILLEGGALHCLSQQQPK
ncbi:agmatine/peptidylarginine deiminase [Verrucomicrobiota bacterium]